MPKFARRPSGITDAHGFTILEITLVLVVLGLIIVTVLKATPMIHLSKLRKTAQMVEDIRTASNLFYREQGRLPGDGRLQFHNASGVLDGMIKENQGGALQGEPAQFRRELIVGRYLAGKVSGSSAETWKSVLGGEVWVEHRTPAGMSALNYIVMTGLAESEDRIFLDLQFDDGDPATGNARYIGSEFFIPL